MRIQAGLKTTGELVANVFRVRKNLSDAQLIHTGGLSIGLAAVGLGIAVNSILLAFPDREEIAENWAKQHDQDYHHLCYTNNPETETSLGISNRATLPTNQMFNRLAYSGPIGRDLAEQLTSNDTIFCFGPRHQNGADFYRPAPSRNIYFTAEDIRDMDAALALHLFERRGLYPYIDAAVEFKERRFITSAALIWKRSNEATKTVTLADAAYEMLRYNGREVFSNTLWQDLENVPKNNAAFSAYRETIQNGGDKNDARQAAFYSAYNSAALQQDTDLSFMRWYESQVDEQAETRTRSVPSVCPSGDGTMRACTKTETYTVYVDPPSFVHSENLHPNNLVALSDIFMDGEPFLSVEDAQNLINNTASLHFHDEAMRRVYDQAVRNASRYCRNHYQGESEIGRGFNIVITAPDMP